MEIIGTKSLCSINRLVQFLNGVGVVYPPAASMACYRQASDIGVNQIGESVLPVQDRFVNAVFHQPAFQIDRFH
jgi:hypothetical protein